MKTQELVKDQDSLDVYRDFDVFKAQPEEQQRIIYALLAADSKKNNETSDDLTYWTFEIQQEEERIKVALTELRRDKYELKQEQEQLKQEQKKLAAGKIEAITGLVGCNINDMSWDALAKLAIIEHVHTKRKFLSRLKFWVK
jgi:Txe/YoeB family toxin of Txe-Axe toxin-antitoxin module